MGLTNRLFFLSTNMTQKSFKEGQISNLIN